MNKSILTSVIAAVLGAGLLFRITSHRRSGLRFAGPTGFAEKIRNMSDEEYAQFQKKFQQGCKGGFFSKAGNQSA